jgi:hypothetical protein
MRHHGHRVRSGDGDSTLPGDRGLAFRNVLQAIICQCRNKSPRATGCRRRVRNRGRPTHVGAIDRRLIGGRAGPAQRVGHGPQCYFGRRRARVDRQRSTSTNRQCRDDSSPAPTRPRISPWRGKGCAWLLLMSPSHGAGSGRGLAGEVIERQRCPTSMLLLMSSGISAVREARQDRDEPLPCKGGQALIRPMASSTDRGRSGARAAGRQIERRTAQSGVSRLVGQARRSERS